MQVVSHYKAEEKFNTLLHFGIGKRWTLDLVLQCARFTDKENQGAERVGYLPKVV